MFAARHNPFTKMQATYRRPCSRLHVYCDICLAAREAWRVALIPILYVPTEPEWMLYPRHKIGLNLRSRMSHLRVSSKRSPYAATSP